jgi:hypothetical protein
MKTIAMAAALTLAASGAAVADHKSKTYGQYAHKQTGGVIYVACFRGPWNEVIWDRPQARFVDSLVNVGYDYPTAHAIAERVCRDGDLVGNPEGLRATMLQIAREYPRNR